MSLRVVLKSRGYAQAGMGDSRMVAALVREFYGAKPVELRGKVMTNEGTYGALERGDYPEFKLGGELASAPVVATLSHNPIGDMKACARAAGLAETEVEKISTCPLVKLLANRS